MTRFNLNTITEKEMETDNHIFQKMQYGNKKILLIDFDIFNQRTIYHFLAVVLGLELICFLLSSASV